MTVSPMAIPAAIVVYRNDAPRLQEARRVGPEVADPPLDLGQHSTSRQHLAVDELPLATPLVQHAGCELHPGLVLVGHLLLGREVFNEDLAMGAEPNRATLRWKS